MLNKIVIMGRLTKDPIKKVTGSGVTVTNFTLAVDRDYTNGDQKETDFIDCVAWRNTGDFVAKYFTKGRMAVVAGRLQLRKYTDKEGNNRTAAEIVADNVYFGDSKKDGQAAPVSGETPTASAPTQAPSAFAALEGPDDEIPF